MTINPKTTTEKMTEERRVGKVLDNYTVIADNVPAKIQIISMPVENVPVYHIEMPKIGSGTEALMGSLIEELAQKVTLEIGDLTDPQKVEGLKQRFFAQAKEFLKEKMPKLSNDKINLMAGLLLHRAYGLGFIEIFLADNYLEEIALNGSKQPITVYHKKYGWCKTTEYVKNDEEIYNLASQIGRKVGREINSLNPIMDAHLLSGDRVASTLFPISTHGNTITIRRFSRNPWTPTYLIDPSIHTFSKEIAAFLWQATQYEFSVIIAGGTASGKTSMLNALCSFMPPTQRIISIEDTREISLPRNLHWNWIPLTSRNPSPEGEGEVTMLDLMIASLRMRPDRIVVGEIRKREQAEALFEAMHTGHSVYATMHADTVQQVKRRLMEPPIQIPKGEIESLHLVLTQYRDRRKGIRRTLELAEILTNSEKDLEVNYLYRWKPRTDGFEKVSESIRILEELNLHTGMTPKEIRDDLREKQEILEWMINNKIVDIDDIGRIMSMYYKDAGYIADAASKNKKASSLSI